MKTALAILVLTTLTAAAAHAQTAPATTPPPPTAFGRGYVEAVAQSAFGDATSQSYGVEGGATVWRNVQVFGEFGQIRNAAPASLGTSAQLIAGFLSQTQSGTTFTVREPVTFFAAGVKYLIPVTGLKVQPYFLGGFGVATVTKDVKFFTGSTDVTAQLSALGVVLGSDLSGDFTKPMITFGGGVTWPVWRQVHIDFQFRASHISAEDIDSSAMTISRAGLGIGMRF